MSFLLYLSNSSRGTSGVHIIPVQDAAKGERHSTLLYRTLRISMS